MADQELVDPSFFDELDKAAQQSDASQNQQLVDPNFFNELDHPNAAQNVNPVSQQSPWYSYPEAFGLGALKGIGELGYGIDKTVKRGINALLPANHQLPLPQNPFNYAQQPGSAFNYLNNVEQAYPTTSGLGKLAGQIGGMWEAPMADVGGAISKLLPQAGNAAGRFLMAPVSGAVNGAAYQPMFSPEQSPSDAMQGGAITGGALGLAGGTLGTLGNLGKNIVSRIGKSATADADAEAQRVGTIYDSIRDDANNAGFIAQPSNYQQTIENALNTIGAQPKSSGNRALEDNLYGRLQDLEDDLQNRPEAFGYQGMRGLVEGLDDEVSKALRQGDNTSAKFYTQLRQAAKSDLLQELDRQGLPDLADRLKTADNEYANVVLPLRNNPASLSGLGGELGKVGLTSLLPHNLGTLAATAMGLHSGESPLAATAKRFASPYQGGPQSVLNTIVPQQQTLNNLNRFLFPMSLGSGN